MMEQQSYTFKTVGSCDIQAEVFRIPDGQIHPVIVLIHGGALISGSRKRVGQKDLMSYLNDGYTVVSIDYRLAPETKINFIIEDLQDAFKWVREQGPELFQIDPDRIVAIGNSAGGYLTLMAGFCVEPRPIALVSFYGYGDIAGKWYAEPDDFYNESPPVSFEQAYKCVGKEEITEAEKPEFELRGDFYLYCRQKGLWPIKVTGYDPKKEPEAFDPLCPIRNITPEYPPTLLIHGDKDTDVPFEQSVIMAAELARVGVEHEFLQYPGVGHGLGAEANDDAVAKTLVFLRKYV